MSVSDSLRLPQIAAIHIKKTHILMKHFKYLQLNIIDKHDKHRFIQNNWKLAVSFEHESSSFGLIVCSFPCFGILHWSFLHSLANSFPKIMNLH